MVPARPAGTILKFDDLPAEYQGDIDRDPPFGGMPGAKPAMTGEEITDLIAFLETLNDGFSAVKR